MDQALNTSLQSSALKLGETPKGLSAFEHHGGGRRKQNLLEMCSGYILCLHLGSFHHIFGRDTHHKALVSD